MKKYSCVFLALAMFLGLAVQAQATSYDPTNLIQPVNALRMNQGGQGDALIGEWYRATVGTNFQGELDNANFLTYVSIVNTSNDWVAAHVRLRTGRYSIEAIDFPILLSPKDVFWFQFEGVGTNSLTGVRIWSADTKTVINSGLSTTGVWENNLSNSILNAFTSLPAEQKGVQELAIGYIEVIGLWKLRFDPRNGDDITLNVPESFMKGVTFQDLQQAFFNNGVPGGAYRLNPTFTDGASRSVIPVDLGNVLTGQVFMGDFTNGLYTGYAMTALADFRTNCGFAHRDEFIRGVVLGGIGDAGAIVYNPLSFNNSSRVDPAYTDPDWATNFGPTWNDGDDLSGGGASAVDSFSLDEVDDALAKQKVTSTYFNGGFRAERTTFSMATITFPTKYLHFFFTYPRFAGDPTPVPWPVGRPADASNARGLINVPGTVGTISLYGSIYGLDEQQPYSVPSPYLLTNLRWEVNCVPIGALSRAKLSEFCFLTHAQGPLDVDGTFYAGWFEMLGFGLMSGPTNNDPRNTYRVSENLAYNREAMPLLNCLATNVNASAFGYDRLIPAMVQVLDFEFANFLHARSFTPAFDNPNDCEQSSPFAGCEDPLNIRF
ncbi:hypothetical protein [Desulforhabdus sp. TSK]|uniref:hypothetical protein n=1 Tax=Desulforhabdus sp. TSK TaxID=2925014 RepID=UPI001FC7C4C5|nr:hypothetical protein [Desulforhabdus sp. TSK]GKT08093.1 hypothetical protein DSTSK_13980 [Desulforhabdus sp. TSK]